VIVVKLNQWYLKKSLVEKAKLKTRQKYRWKQKGHGHDTQCCLEQWEADEQMKQQWQGLRTYIRVERQGIRYGKSFKSVTYYISSAVLSARRFAQLIRYHRKIENSLHWAKDVILQEDRCGLVKPQQAFNMAILRDISFNLHVMKGYKSLSAGISAMGEKITRLWQVITATRKLAI